MEEKESKGFWDWTKEHRTEIVWAGIGAAVLATMISKKSSKSRKEIHNHLMNALRSGNAVMFRPDGNVVVIPKKD